MPATPLTVAAVTIQGVDPNQQAVDAVNGNSFTNTAGKTYLLVNNGSGGSINTTILVQQPNRPAGDGWPAQTAANIVVAVVASDAKIIGPFPSAYVDGSGLVQVTFSSGTSVTASPFNVA